MAALPALWIAAIDIAAPRLAQAGPCERTSVVRRPALGGQYNTIQAAINALPKPIPANWCVNVDSSTYSEQVTVQNYAFQYSTDTLTIQADPGLALSTRPTVTPPVNSTAAFQIVNASVTIGGFWIVSTNTVAYGVYASSHNIAISSVGIYSNNTIWTAGVQISSYSSVWRSSITVQAAHGLWIIGSSNTVSASTMSASQLNKYGLFLLGASSNVITSCSISSGVYISSGATFNTITLSTMVTTGGNVVLTLSDSSSNTISRSFIFADYNTLALVLRKGSAYNTLSQSTVTASANKYVATLINDDSTCHHNLFDQSMMDNPNHPAQYSQGVELFGNYNTVSLSTLSAGITSCSGCSESALAIYGDSNTVSQSFIYSRSDTGGYGLYWDGSYNTVVRSTMVSMGVDDGSGQGAVGGWGSYNTITQSFIRNQNATSNNAATALTYNGYNNLVLDSFISSQRSSAVNTRYGVNDSTILRSTLTSVRNGVAALNVNTSENLTISNCYIAGSTAVYFEPGYESTNTVINASVLVATAGAGHGLYVEANRYGSSVGLSMSSNTILGNSSGAGIWLQDDLMGLVNLSTNTIRGFRYGILAATQTAQTSVWITSNTIISTLSATADTYGIYMNGLITGATIQNNAIVMRNPGGGNQTFYGLYGKTIKGVDIDHNRFNNPGMVTAGSAVSAYFAGAQQTRFKFNDVNSTGTGLTNAYLMQLANSTVTIKNNIFFSSFGVTGSSASLYADRVSGFDSDYNDWYSSNTSLTMYWNQYIPYARSWAFDKDAGSISAPPLWKDPAAGAEDFHPLSTAGRYDVASGGFVNDAADSPTIDDGALDEEIGLETSPNGGIANQGSYGQTAEASRSAAAAAGCQTTKIVKQAGGADCTSISQCVAGIPSQLSGNYCIFIQDAATYSERVTVAGIDANGYQIVIGTVSPLARAVVNPPQLSTAAFQILNSDVVVQYINVIGTNSVAYGILVSSPRVTISNVDVAGNGPIYTAGIRVSSWTAISYSSMTMGNAHGIYIDGTHNTVSISTVTKAPNNANVYPLYLNGASYSTITQSSFTSRLAAFTVQLNSNANYNTIQLSTITANAGGSPGAAF
ncbi:MAG: hypothetical protein HY551_00605, partial [Elusimicrobia bacterium]|nr:hypothetical protein [Elusimicrobiota bacterium]